MKKDDLSGGMIGESVVQDFLLFFYIIGDKISQWSCLFMRTDRIRERGKF